MQTPYHRDSLWKARGLSPPLLVKLHSYYSLSFGWHITYQFQDKGGFYSLPEHEFNLLFSPCLPKESFSSKIASLWRRLFYINPPASSPGKSDATSPFSSSK